MRTILTACVLLGLAWPAYAASPDGRWRLEDLYPDVQAWQADLEATRARLPELAGCAGHLGDSVARFKQCMDLNQDIQKEATRLQVYAGLAADIDTADANAAGLAERASAFGTDVAGAAAFLGPELIALGAPRLDSYFAADASLDGYRFFVDSALREKAHTLDVAGEELVANFGLLADTPQTTYTTLTNADMPWPKVRFADGEEETLDDSSYFTALGRPNRADRKLAADRYWATWKAFEHTTGATLYAQAKSDLAFARAHKYPTALAAALDANAIPVGVYETLIAQANANLPTLHRYLRLRQRLLGLPDLSYYDLYVPLVSGGQSFTVAEAKQLVLAAVAPLGPDYVNELRADFERDWMDAYPRPHKKSGAYMQGSAYDVHPYVFMNFTGDYDSVSTLAHEWGHAMHSNLANHAQNFLNSGYPIFIGEIASTFNEALLLDHMLKIARNDDERLRYLGSALENLRGTFFLQALFAEFERDLHARVDAGGSLTGAELTAMYSEIVRRYYGEKEGVIHIDEAQNIAWSSVPHFYSSFYVYQYATSIAASAKFEADVVAGKPGARERYLNLLRAGGSAYPYELVKAAGVDLASPAPYEALVARMNQIMDEIDAIEARR